MRTTLSIDDDLFFIARSIAHAKSISLGAAISELMRKGLASDRPVSMAGGFPVFEVPPGAKPITTDDVRQAEDEP